MSFTKGQTTNTVYERELTISGGPWSGGQGSVYHAGDQTGTDSKLFVLKIKNSTNNTIISEVVATSGKQLTTSHLDKNEKIESGEPFATFVPHPKNPSILGLRNDSSSEWSFANAKGDMVAVPVGRAVPLDADNKITFSDVRYGVFEKNTGGGLVFANNIYEKSKDALEYIYSSRPAGGIDMLLGPELKRNISDHYSLAEPMGAAKLMIIQNVHEKGCAKILRENITASDADKGIAIKKAVEALVGAGFDKDLCQIVIWEFAEVLGWSWPAETSDRIVDEISRNSSSINQKTTPVADDDNDLWTPDENNICQRELESATNSAWRKERARLSLVQLRKPLMTAAAVVCAAVFVVSAWWLIRYFYADYRDYKGTTMTTSVDGAGMTFTRYERAHGDPDGTMHSEKEHVLLPPMDKNDLVIAFSVEIETLGFDCGIECVPALGEAWWYSREADAWIPFNERFMPISEEAVVEKKALIFVKIPAYDTFIDEYVKFIDFDKLALCVNVSDITGNLNGWRLPLFADKENVPTDSEYIEGLFVHDVDIDGNKGLLAQVFYTHYTDDGESHPYPCADTALIPSAGNAGEKIIIPTSLLYYAKTFNQDASTIFADWQVSIGTIDSALQHDEGADVNSKDEQEELLLKVDACYSYYNYVVTEDFTKFGAADQSAFLNSTMEGKYYFQKKAPYDLTLYVEFSAPLVNWVHLGTPFDHVGNGGGQPSVDLLACRP
jgi:hypothetical protein